MRPDLTRHPAGGWYREDDPGDATQSNGPAYSVALEDIAVLQRECAGKYCLEIGTGCGVSANAMAEVADLVVTLGVREWERENIWPLLAPNVAPTLNREHARACGPYEVVFIDGNHREQAVVDDIRFARDVLKSGGTLILHDASFDTVKAAMRTEGVEGVYYASPAGILVSR